MKRNDGDAGEPLPIAQDSRPPEQLESTTRHIFLMNDGEYRCSRCGVVMNDRSLDEACGGSR